MKSFNLIFDDFSSIDNFIQDNNIPNTDKVLIQIFSGICDSILLKNIIKKVYEILPNATIVGATTDGEIIGSSVTTKNIIISFSVFETTKLVSYSSEFNESEDSYELGANIVAHINQPNLKVVITFANGLGINGEEFLNGICSVEHDFVVAGGMAGDNGRFQNTFVFLNDSFFEKGGVAVGLVGDELNVANTYSLNWEPLGRWMEVTKSVKNRVYEIEGVKAFDVYAKYLGADIAQSLPKTGAEFPLIIKNDYLPIARAVLIKHDDGSLSFAGNINTGDYVRFAYGNVEMILHSIEENANFLANHFVESIFIYSCMARRRLFGVKASVEIEPLNKIAPVCGFYTYGEFFSKSRSPQLLNETMTILALSEGNGKATAVDVGFDWNVNYEVNSNILAIKALTHLVATSTAEIEDLYAQSRKKDEIMFNQSRLAAMGEMIGNIAHQWRQPLSALTMIVQHIQLAHELGMLDNESLNKNVEDAMRIAQYMSTTIDDFRNFFQPNANKEHFSINIVLSKVADFIKSMLANHKIQLQMPTDNCPDCTIDGYESMMFQAIVAIINNSKDAFVSRKVENRMLILDVYYDNENMHLLIEDNAGGIDISIINKIFDPYFTTKHQSQGTGLGLYITQTIMKQHMKGDVLVRLNEIGGTTFEIVVPYFKK